MCVHARVHACVSTRSMICFAGRERGDLCESPGTICRGAITIETTRTTLFSRSSSTVEYLFSCFKIVSGDDFRQIFVIDRVNGRNEVEGTSIRCPVNHRCRFRALRIPKTSQMEVSSIKGQSARFNIEVLAKITLSRREVRSISSRWLATLRTIAKPVRFYENTTRS